MGMGHGLGSMAHGSPTSLSPIATRQSLDLLSCSRNLTSYWNWQLFSRSLTCKTFLDSMCCTEPSSVVRAAQWRPQGSILTSCCWGQTHPSCNSSFRRRRSKRSRSCGRGEKDLMQVECVSSMAVTAAQPTSAVVTARDTRGNEEMRDDRK